MDDISILDLGLILSIFFIGGIGVGWHLAIQYVYTKLSEVDEHLPRRSRTIIDDILKKL